MSLEWERTLESTKRLIGQTTGSRPSVQAGRISGCYFNVSVQMECAIVSNVEPECTAAKVLARVVISSA